MQQGGSRDERVEAIVYEMVRAPWLRLRRSHHRVAGAGFCSRGRRRHVAGDQPLTTLQNDLQGPVAHAVTTAAIIGTGIMWSVSEHGTGVRKMSAVAFGGAAALGATTLMTTLFPLGGALF
jgi:type IV secretory pathway VirB2 component (pilin)